MATKEFSTALVDLPEPVQRGLEDFAGTAMSALARAPAKKLSLT